MKKSIILNSTAICSAITAFESGDSGKWKLDENGAIVLQDGNPIYINSDGKEQTIARDTITRLNGENHDTRKQLEQAKSRLEKFKDIDADAARKAIDTVSKLDEKTLIDAGEVDKVRNEIKTQYEAQIGELKTQNGSLQGKVEGMTLDNAFGGSVYVQENIAVPVEMFRNTFGKHFKIEDGKVNAYGADGARLMSKKSIGAYADFDEAAEILVSAYPYKDTITKAPDTNGSGSGGGGGGRGNGATVTIAQFDLMTPAQQSDIAAKAGAGEINIID
jgi:hypothetical protein